MIPPGGEPPFMAELRRLATRIETAERRYRVLTFVNVALFAVWMLADALALLVRFL